MTVSPSTYVSKAQRTRNARKANTIANASEAGQAPDKQKPYAQARQQGAKAAKKLGKEPLDEFVKKSETLSTWARRGEALTKAPKTLIPLVCL